MSYTIDDLKQSLAGSVVAVIVFFAIRGGNPYFFNPTVGLIMMVVLLWIYYNGFRMQNKQTHFIMNVLVAFVVCSVMALVFGLITINEILSYKVLGSLVSVGVIVATPVALIFDKFNFTSPLKRFYVRGK